MAVSCLFCEKSVTNDDPSFRATQTLYTCKRCGPVHLRRMAADDFGSKNYSSDAKAAISITLRNDWERRAKNPKPRQELTLDDIELIVSQFRSLDPIEKMDYALDVLNKSSTFAGQKLKVKIEDDYPLYYCRESKELFSVLCLLEREGFVIASDPLNPHNDCSITAKGYRRLREIQKPNRSSNQCFVAMWFASEMDHVFVKAIKPAIEYVELGAKVPRYRAVKIDNVEHLNDINDEIIAQIRRSRFVVCDLTGYRGGVYFEAGFAYGLGLEVVYTCRKDWTKAEALRDKSGNEVTALFDSSGRKIVVKKEGVHFDLAHRNRIEWEDDKLEEFKIKLENRIKANIF